jgi:acyl-CoA thioester hydrolase
MNAPAWLDAANAGSFTGFEGVVRPDWIDANRHMNVAWYDHVFDIAESALFAAFAIDEDYIRTSGCGMFRLEKRIRYERELVEGDRVRVEGRIVSTDHRLVRHYHELLNLTSGTRAASAEYTSIHVDLSTRKSARIADPEILRRLDVLHTRHAALPSISTS